MPRNGSGTYIRTDGTYTGSTVFTQEAANGVDIEAVNLDAEAQDMADAITGSIAKDGQTTPTANLPMGGFKHTGVADATSDTEYASKGQMDTAIGLVSPMGLEWKTGLLVSNNSTDAEHDIDVAAGSIMDDTNTYRMNCQAMTKRIDAAFAVGTGNGGLASADSLGNNTWYGVFELQVAATSSNAATSDVIFATTRARALSSTGVTGVFDICRLVGCARTDGSANILAFVDGGDGWNVWSSKIDSTSGTGSDTGASFTVAVPPLMIGAFTYSVDGLATPGVMYGVLTQTSQNNNAASATNFDIKVESDSGTSFYGTISKFLKVDGSSQIRHRESVPFRLEKVFTNAWKFLPTVTDLV